MAGRLAGKRILIDFTGVNCASCRQMERTVMVRPDVAAQMGQFVTVHRDYHIAALPSVAGRYRIEDYGTEVLEALPPV